jgi:YVTN family beta-propeller protein
MHTTPLGPVRLIGATLLTGILFCAANRCSAQSTPAQSLLALSKTDHTLAIVDPVSLKVIAKMPVGSDPHEVVASSDGRTAYVSIYGGGSLHEMDVLDLVAYKALTPVDTRPFFGPHGIEFAGGKVWITAEGSKCVARYDPATRAFDFVLGTGQDRTHMIYITRDGKSVYTTNVSSGTVSILTDTLMRSGPPGAPAHEDWKQTLVPVSRGSEGFDVTPDGRQLWTASAGDGTIAIIDLATRQVVDKIEAGVKGANRLKFTPDGKWVLITSLSNGDLVVYDAATRKEAHRVKIGHGAAGILVSPDGSRAFLGCTPDNYVAVVDLRTLQVIGHIDVGGGPDGLAWAVRR